MENDEVCDLLEKFKAEMDAAEKCKRDGLPTYTWEQMLEMAEEIMEGVANENKGKISG